MSVESVKVAEAASRACSLHNSQTDPATFAAKDFDHLMHGEGRNGEGCHPFFEQLNRLNALLNNESAMVNNGPQIKQQIQSMITQGVESGLIDLAELPDSGDGSGVRMLTDRIGVDTETGAVQVRIGSDGDDNRFQALSTVSSKDMTAIGLEFSSFAVSELNGESKFSAAAVNEAEHPDQFTLTTPTVSEASQGRQNVSTESASNVTPYAGGTSDVVMANPPAAAASSEAGAAPESGAPAGAGGTAALPAEWPALAERLRNSEIPEEALQPGQPSQQATYIMSARRAEDLFERVQNGEMSKGNVNDLGHALQQMANVRLGLHVHSANRHELAELSRLANGQSGGEQWTSLSQAQRDEALAESMGMDTATWAKEVRPLIDQATQFHEMREDMSFKIDDAAKVVVAVAATYFTAGAASAGAFGSLFATSAGSAFAGGFAGSFVSSGGDLGEAVEGGVTGAVTGGLLGTYGGSAADNMKTFGQNAAMRGIAEEVSGGDFEDGVMQEATNFAGGVASEYASGMSATQIGQFAIEAGISGGLAELNGGEFADGVAATATEYVPYLTDGMAESMNIQPGTWQQLAFDAVVSGATAEFTGGSFEDGFRDGAAHGLQSLADGNLAEQLEVDNPYLAILMDAGLNGAAAEISGGEALHKKFGAEEGSVLSSVLTAGVTGIGYELSDQPFADGFWNSAAASLNDYVDNMDLPEDSTARMLIEAGVAGVESEMLGGEFGDSFLRVIGSHTSGIVGDQYGETAGVATEAFLNRLIENGGDIGDALMVAGQAGMSQ